MADPLEKIRALIHRAVHPSTPIEEARTAAIIALRMATEAGLELAPASDRAELAEFRKSAERFREASARVTKNGSGSAPFDVTQAFRRRPQKRERPPASDYAIIVSMYRGYCRACRRQYDEGDEIAYRRGSGSTHYTCRAYWDEKHDGT